MSASGYGPRVAKPPHPVATTAPLGRIAAGQETRARLLDAAITRLADAGPDASFESIAADVGVTKGALYHHFGSKEGLVTEVYREAVRRHAEHIVEVSHTGTGRLRLHRLILESARLFGSGTPFYRLLLRLHVEAGTSRPYLADTARTVQRRQRQYMTELVRTGQADGSIRADIDPDALGGTVNATLQGFLLQQIEPASTQRRSTEAFAHLLDQLIA